MVEIEACGPSLHLSWKELACHDGTVYPVNWRGDRAVLLGQAFEAIRAAVGQPLIVLSAYRTPKFNRRIGGAKMSQHVEGRALDLEIPEGFTVDTFEQLVHASAKTPNSVIRGIGIYPTFLHMDVRPIEKLLVWVGKRLAAEVTEEV